MQHNHPPKFEVTPEHWQRKALPILKYIVLCNDTLQRPIVSSDFVGCDNICVIGLLGFLLIIILIKRALWRPSEYNTNTVHSSPRVRRPPSTMPGTSTNRANQNPPHGEPIKKIFIDGATCVPIFTPPVNKTRGWQKVVSLYLVDGMVPVGEWKHIFIHAIVRLLANITYYTLHTVPSEGTCFL